MEAILPFVKAFKTLVQRKPFLVQRLEEVLKKLLNSLEFFDDDGRRKIAIGARYSSMVAMGAAIVCFWLLCCMKCKIHVAVCHHLCHHLRKVSHHACSAAQ